MADKDSDFLKRLHATFRAEAREHIEAMFSGVDMLERTPDKARQAELVEVVFREAHSLKGAARSLNLTQIESACQTLESTFSSMKRQELSLTKELFDKLHQALNHLNRLLETHSASASNRTTGITQEISTAPLLQTTIEPSIDRQEENSSVADTVRIATAKLDSIFLQAEEMLSAKLLAQQRKQELKSMQAVVAAWGKEWVSLKTRHADFYSLAEKQPQWYELLSQNMDFIKSLIHQLNTMTTSADQDQRMLGHMVDELLDGMKSALMLPFSTLLEVFPRLVRDLAKDYGKDIDLVIQGGELEADRRVLEEIKAPLIHLVRNCVDHGIETPEERVRRHKPACGTITIAILPRNGNRVEIKVSDDGSGIDSAKVKASAERLGVLDKESASGLDEQAIMELIYQSGLSTSPIITEISGRGLGLTIVREKTEKLGGTVLVETQSNVGTNFRIVLPLTLATYRGVSVRVGEQEFVLPTRHVEQTLRIEQDNVRTVENRATIQLNEETLSLVWLSDVLEIPRRNIPDTTFLQVAVLATAGKRIAFVVDEVLNEQEVLVKNLGTQLARVRNIAAATIHGSGKVVPILNVSDLLKSALRVASDRIKNTTAEQVENSSVQKSVLVVEDSITARSLLKGIFEVAGYKVITAVDGIDGFTQLRSGTFDIVVSDVEMPRMDGFDLTAKIRSDKKLADLPVVLVTALESREHRERGIDVGANAYIVKRSFEQSNLLEVVSRLV